MKMKIGKLAVKKQVLFGALTALGLAMAPVANCATYLTETATVMGACGRLFDIDANAAGMTAPQRASAIQKNLDYALIHARTRGPGSVRVIMVNNNPVVTLDGYHIATADTNSAARHRVAPTVLAEEWATALRTCLADTACIDRYLSMLTGRYPALAVTTREEMVAYARAGLFLPIALRTPIDSETSQIGDCVEAVLLRDIPLPTTQSSTQFDAYLPRGTVAVGQLTDASNGYLGRNAFSIRFNQLRTPDGEAIPIEAHILGGVGTWVAFNTSPDNVEFGAINSVRIPPRTGVTPVKGSVCGGWRGYPIAASPDVPFQKLAFKRHTGIAVPAGEQMMLQLSAPSAIAVCTNCSGPRL